MFINYAHRGASEYAPESTFAAFRLGLEMGANGIETDVRASKDGILILHHNAEIVTADGTVRNVCEMTLEELQRIDLGVRKAPEYAGERIVTLDDFLAEYAGKDLQLAIEIKQNGIEAQTVSFIRRFACAEKTVVTSFGYDILEEVRRIAPDLRLGWLVREVTEDVLQKAEASGFYQICPKADTLDEPTVALLRKKGFSVRAWGVKDVPLMCRMLDLAVDGMTVNFPDKLTEETARRGIAL